MTNPASAHTNRLAREKSPYLLQHAANPVDWYAWGPEAFEKAKKENKPIFLSIGYSTCHWCHVMAHESFENEEIAKLLNVDFVSIKVDREERPDIDQLYMTSVQAMTGSGGWPLTVFLTPDGKPFTGGTYFPPEDRWGRNGMKTLLPRIAKIWKEKREEIEKTGEQLIDLLQERSGAVRAKKEDREIVDEKILTKGYGQFDARFDPAKGGFGGAPKFPRSHDLSFLLRYFERTGEKHALEMVHVTLQHMARGGMYDQLGGGFHRYSTDEHWLVPHFEKMLYDQAILAKTYLEAYQATKEPFYADVARDIFRYVLRDMTDPAGGFYSAEDADSEGEEGKFYVWRPEEIVRVLGESTGRLFNAYYGVTDEGNFEHAQSILHVSLNSKPFPELEKSRQKLFEVREKRIHPHKDDKILTAWNGMMISALALGAQILEENRYLEAAGKAARFILEKMQKDGRLLRRYRAGEAAIPAFQEDYAFLGLAALDLYETDFDSFWLTEAKRLTEEMIRLFWDDQAGGFFYTAADGEVLLARSKEYYDGAVPSGNSIAALLMFRLGRMLADSSLEKKVEELVKSNAVPLGEYPMAYPQLLVALDFALGPSKEIVISGRKADPNFGEALRLIRNRFLPRHVLLHHPEGTKNQPVKDDKITVYVCENHICQFPTTDLQELEKLLVPKTS